MITPVIFSFVCRDFKQTTMLKKLPFLFSLLFAAAFSVSAQNIELFQNTTAKPFTALSKAQLSAANGEILQSESTGDMRSAFVQKPMEVIRNTEKVGKLAAQEQNQNDNSRGESGERYHRYTIPVFPRYSQRRDCWLGEREPIFLLHR